MIYDDFKEQRDDKKRFQKDGPYYDPLRTHKTDEATFTGTRLGVDFSLFSLYDHVLVVPTPFVSSPNGIAPFAASSFCLYGNRSRKTIIILLFVCFGFFSFSFVFYAFKMMLYFRTVYRLAW